MSDFSFLNGFILQSEKESQEPLYKDYTHHLLPLKKSEVEEISTLINIPKELDEFYHQVGYGFFFQNDDSHIDRFLDVESFKNINLHEGFYEYDPDLEMYDSEGYIDKRIFYDLNEGVYLLMDNEEVNGSNSIYFFTNKIANSLEEFIKRLIGEGHYFG